MINRITQKCISHLVRIESKSHVVFAHGYSVFDSCVMLFIIRYYGIALMNAGGGMIRANSRTQLTIIYQVHREGIAAPLTYAPLSEPWTDHMYYFSTVNFRHSGRYTISFIAEGANAGSIPPLVFPVEVFAQHVRCGMTDALNKLAALSHVEAVGRQVLLNRRELMSVVSAPATSAVGAVRKALLSLYAALPSGALLTDGSEPPSDGSSVAEYVTEPAGWNALLDQIWRSAVMSAVGPVELMECVVLLEYYINKSWLAAPHNKLLNALPNPHFALRCVSFASVALRVYCIDRAVEYTKAAVAPRERRSGVVMEQSTVTVGGRSSKPAAAITEDFTEGRGRRSAALLASSLIKSQQSSWDRDGAAIDYSNQPWGCPVCSVSNPARARSCDTCGEKKPSAEALQSAAQTRGRSSNPRNRATGSSRQHIRSSGKRRRGGESSEEDEDEEESSSDDSQQGDSGSEHDNERRQSGRKRAVRSYREVGSDEEEEDNGRVQAKPRRGAGDDSEEQRVRAFYEDYRRRVLPLLMQQMDQRIADQVSQADTQGNSTADDLTVRLLSVLRRLLSDIRSQPFWAPVDPVDVPSYR